MYIPSFYTHKPIHLHIDTFTNHREWVCNAQSNNYNNVQFDEQFLFGVKKNIGEDYLQEAEIVQTQL